MNIHYAYNPSSPSPGIYSKEIKCMSTQSLVHKHHRNSIFDNQKQDPTWMFINRWMDKLWYIHILQSIFLKSNKKTVAICNMDESQNNYTKWKKKPAPILLIPLIYNSQKYKLIFIDTRQISNYLYRRVGWITKGYKELSEVMFPLL